MTANLQSVNVGNEPTFISANGETIIDVTFTTIDIVNKIKNWHVADEVTLSDHRYIRFQVTTETEKMKPHFNPRKTNWDKFREIMKRTIPKTQPFPTSTKELENDVYNLTSAMNTAFVKSTKIHRTNILRKYKHLWWTSELKMLKGNTNRAHRTFKKNKCCETWHNYT